MQWRRRHRNGLPFTAVLTVCTLGSLASTCPDDLGSALDIDVVVTPSSLTLEVGQTGQLQATVANVPAGEPRTVTWGSNAPEVATVDQSGLVTAIGPGTAIIAAQSDADDLGFGTATVTVTAPSTQVVFRGVARASTGEALDPGNVFGRIVANYEVLSPPATGNWVVQAVLDAHPVFCNRTGVDVECPIDTAQPDESGGPLEPGMQWPALITNGTYGLRARLTAGDLVVHSTEQPITLNNRTRLYLAFGPQPPPFDRDQTGEWRGGDLEMTITPMIFDPGIDAFSVGLDAIPLDAAVALDLGNGPGNGSTRLSMPPFRYMIDPALNPLAEAAYTLGATLQDGSGQPLEFKMMGSKLDLWLDFYAPRITFGETPPSQVRMRVRAVKLNYPTGPYSAGAEIPLSWITGGIETPAHPPFCGYEHLHGTITIADPNLGATYGPFQDPQDLYGDECGHGQIVTVTVPEVDLPVGGLIEDAQLSRAYVGLYRAVGGCDGDELVDDVQVEEGSGQGQVDQARYDVLAGGGAFMVNFRLMTPATPTGYCIRVEAEDGAVDGDGDPAPNAAVWVFSVPLTF